MLLPQLERKKGHITLVLCIFRMNAFSFSFLRGMEMGRNRKKKKKREHHLKCDEHHVSRRDRYTVDLHTSMLF